MNNINSTYRNNIALKTNAVLGMTGKSNPNVTSKAIFDMITDARTCEGAEEIEALAGAFSACKIGNWKDEKTALLKEQYLW